MTFQNASPLRYPGGKTRACPKLYEILNTHFNLELFETLVSPFFGGGSFEFYLQNKKNLAIIANDKFTPLYVFWESCKKNKEKLCNILEKNLGKITKEDFLHIRRKIMNEDDCFEQAKMFFIINRCSFSGSTLSGGFSLESSKKRFTKSSIQRIANLNLSRTTFFNQDFEEFLEKEFEKSITFLDPPYYLEKKSNLYGSNGDLHENFNHEKLQKCLKQKKNWIMTYNNCNFIRNLYKDNTIIETSWSYGMNKDKSSSEIVIIG
jgi:DNA adenine methylase